MEQKEQSTASGHGCPVHGEGPALPGTGATDYERYMNVDALLSLQKTPEERAHPDELLFQTIHQSFELWLKMVREELDRVRDRVDAGDLHTSVRLLRRCRKAVAANTAALAVFDTMTPVEFHGVRRQLGQGSGAESPGFRLLQREAPRLWPHVEALLEREGTGLDEVYLDDAHRPDLLALLEAMTDLDQDVHLWRQAHLALVKRIIGRDVKSLKGYAVRQLEEDIHTTLWPALWTVRERVTEAEGTSPS